MTIHVIPMRILGVHRPILNISKRGGKTVFIFGPWLF